MNQFVYFGSNGAYSMNDTTTTYTALNQQNLYGQAIGLGQAGLGAFSGGYTQQLGTGSGLLSTFIANVDQATVSSPSKPAKKTARGLAKLKEEIDGWHGDVLERMAA